MAKAKRASGAGRKPKGEFSGKGAWMSTRITQETRDKLEAAAKESGRSLSQEIERRLDDSFGIQREQDPRLRALFFLISETIRAIPGSGDVFTDPHRFQQLKTGVATLLTKFTPPGEVVAPEATSPDMQAVMEIPGGMGVVAAEVVWTMLQSTEPPDPDYAPHVPTGSPLYAMPQARRDLGVRFKTYVAPRKGGKS